MSGRSEGREHLLLDEAREQEKLTSCKTIAVGMRSSFAELVGSWVGLESALSVFI